MLKSGDGHDSDSHRSRLAKCATRIFRHRRVDGGGGRRASSPDPAVPSADGAPPGWAESAPECSAPKSSG